MTKLTLFFEPYVRIFTGIAELCTALLLLIPRTRLTGAFAGLGLLIGAIGFHLSPWLGINVPTIGHFLFVSAVCSLVISLVTISRLRKEGAMLWPITACPLPAFVQAYFSVVENFRYGTANPRHQIPVCVNMMIAHIYATRHIYQSD